MQNQRYQFTKSELKDLGKQVYKELDNHGLKAYRNDDIKKIVSLKVKTLFRELPEKEVPTEYAVNPDEFVRKTEIELDPEKEQWIKAAMQLERKLTLDITCTLDKELVYSKAVPEYLKKKGISPREKAGDIVVPNNCYGD